MTSRPLSVLALLFITSVAFAQPIALWDPPLPREMLAADTESLAAVLSQAGYEVTVLDTDQLLDPSVLSPEKAPLLLCPALGAYPHGGLGLLAEYLQAGGSFMSLGGVPFDLRVVKAGGNWQAVMVPERPPGEVIQVADFEQGVPARVSRMGGEGEGFSFEVTPHEGGGGSFLRASVEDLAQYEYVRVDLRDTGDDGYSILHFRARGDENTSLLGIEMNESDESRWKMVLPLSPQWRDYTIYIPHMLSYATEGRGDEGDWLHPGRLARVALGFTRGMVGGGPHRLDLDDVQRWHFGASDPAAVSRSTQVLSATLEAYGARQIKAPTGESALSALFAHTERFEAAPLRADGTSTTCDGSFVDYPWAGEPTYKQVSMSKTRLARLVPLLADDHGRLAGAIAMHSAGALAGASLAWLATDANDLLERPALKSAMLAALDLLLRRPHVISMEPSFGVADGRPAVTLKALVRAPRAAEVDCRLVLDWGQRSRPPGEFLTARMAAGETREFSATIPATEMIMERFWLWTRVSAGDGPDDAEELMVDTAGVMRRLCDFFVERQTPEGTFAGPGFVDERAARGLLAMYDMTGDERYRDAAIRWGEHEIAIQREDGGYRMGYGITDKGEACYVADGGEIAIGMVRLVSYVPEDRRQAFMDSLRRYFEYRESFRLDDGRISVGWVLHGTYIQGGERDAPLDAPARSDKPFGFVVGCTLAAATAWARLTGLEADRAMAEHDTRWYLDDGLKATSVSGEAAQWAHYFLRDEGLRAELAQRMKETLLPWPPTSDSWWYTSGGRSAVTLGALSYYATQIEPDPLAQTEVLRGTCYMVGDKSPSGLLRVLADDHIDQDEWRYLCYASVSLAEVLRPLVTMRGIGE